MLEERLTLEALDLWVCDAAHVVGDSYDVRVQPPLLLTPIAHTPVVPPPTPAFRRPYARLKVMQAAVQISVMA